MDPLRVFLSSPGDVAEERALALQLLKAELPDDPLLYDSGVTFKVVSWDDPASPTPMPAGLTPQEAVNRFKRKPSECDILIVILWSRLGTHLDLAAFGNKPGGGPYLSGTEWEFEDAWNGQKRPEILVYRRTEEPQIGNEDPAWEEKRRQYDLVEGFFKRFKNPDGSLKGGYTAYKTPAEFKQRLANDLKHLIHEHLRTGKTETSPEVESASITLLGPASLLAIAAVLAIIIAAKIFIAGDQYTQNVDSYFDRLTGTNLTQRVSAIQALQEITIKSAKIAPRTCNALSSFIINAAATSRSEDFSRLPDDIQRAVSALSALRAAGRCLKPQLNGSDLRRLQLQNGKLMDAVLTNATLEGANLSGADLSFAGLDGSILTDANLTDAILIKTKLLGSILRDTDLTRANLTGAEGLTGADLTKVRSITGAVFDGVNLQRTRLPQDLRGVSLKDADLRGTDLRRARGLCWNKIRALAKIDQTTREPENHDC